MDFKLVAFVFIVTLLVGFENSQNVPVPHRKRDTLAMKSKLDNTKTLLKETRKANKQLSEENKRLKKMLDTSANKQVPTSDMESENVNLKALLKETRAVNKRLKKQNRRQMQMWFALEQMCKVLRQPSLEVHQPPLEDSSNTTKTTKTDTKTALKENKAMFNIQPISIATNYVRSPQGEKTNVSIEYTARGKPTSQWLILRMDRYITRGWTEYRETTGTYVSGVELDSHILLSHFIFVRVFDASDKMQMGLNASWFQRSDNHSIEYPLIIIEDRPEPIIAPTFNELNSTFYVRGNLSDNIDVGAFIKGVDVSNDPPTVFEVLDNDRSVTITNNEISANRSIVTVHVANWLSRHGGMLRLSFTSRPKSATPFESIALSRTFHVLSNETKTVVRPDTLGVYPTHNMTLLYGPFQSILCMAMSEQGANITLYKETADGWEELPHDFYLADEFTVIKSFTIDANDTQAEGTYICSATSMGRNVNTRTEVIRFVEAVFDETATGVQRNDSSQLKIRCKATGTPVPYLTLTVYDRYGPDLSSSPKYTTVRSNPTPSTAVLDVTVTPVDRDIYRVYCVINQDGGRGRAKEIQIFSEPESGPYWDILSVTDKDSDN